MTVTQDYFHLSPQQLRVFRLGSVGGHGAFGARVVVAIDGPVDPGLLAACLEELVARHEILRTGYDVCADAPVQWIDDRVAVDLTETDRMPPVPGGAAGDGPGRLEAHLVREPAGDTRLVLLLPALAIDREGLGLLVAELAEIYRAAEATGEPPEQDPDVAPLQVVDVADVLQESLDSDDGAASRAFWRQRSFVQPEGLLVGERPGEAAVFEVAPLAARLSPETARGLRRLAAREASRGGLDAVLAALWGATLARSGAGRPVALGLVVSNRGMAGLEEALGPWSQVVPLELPVDTDAPLERWFEAAERGVAQLLPWKDLFDWDRFAGEVPFARFQLEVASEPRRHGAGPATFTAVERSAHLDRFHLKLTAEPLPGTEEDGGEGGLALTLDRDVARFDRPAAERLVERFVTLARAVAAGARGPVAALPLMGEAETARLLAAAHGAAAPEAPPGTLHGLVHVQAARTPDAVALVQGGERRTYRQLVAGADRIARRLAELGVGPETRVALAVPRSPAMVEAILGVLGAGGAYVPLDPDYPRERLELMLEDSGSRVLVTADGAGEELAGGFGGAVVRLARLADAPSAASEPLDRDVGLGPDATAYVIYTSGSTGRPKGVAVPHRAIVNRLLWMETEFPLAASDAVLQKTSYGFDASIWELFVPLFAGARLVLAEPGAQREPRALARAVAEHGVSVLQLVPSQLGPFLDLDAGVLNGVRANLERLYCGGEALPVELARRAIDELDVTLTNLYGPTEAAIDSTFRPVPPESLPVSGVVPIGRPLAGDRVYVVDASMGLVPEGEAGELVVGGVGLAHGYLGRSGLTAERFVPDPFSRLAGERLYRTGDLVRRSLVGVSAGDLEFLGRIDHQVKLRGFRIELGEVEAALLEVPGVSEAAAEVRDDLLVAHVAAHGAGGAGTEAAAMLDPRQIQSHLAERLPPAMVPGLVRVAPELPRLPNGKLDRRALSALALVRDTVDDEGLADPTEEILAGLWADLLGIDRVGRRDSFFEIGGQSILAMRVVARVRSLFGVEIGVAELFEEPTVAGLARRIRRAERDETGRGVVPLEALDPAARAAGVPLSFSQQRLWFIDRLRPDSAAYNIPSPVRLRGALEPAVLARVLGAVVERHEVLRTRFEWRDDETGGRPVQVVGETPADLAPVVDLSGLATEAAGAETERLARREALRPFDLAAGRPVRSALVRVAPDDQVLLWTMHHLVSDAWSVGLLVREVVALYRAFAEGRRTPLAPLAIQYADFAAWQRRSLSGERLDSELAVWRERLGGAPEVTPLPLDRPRRRGSSNQGAGMGVELDRELVGRLDALSRRHGGTRFMTLLAVFTALLARLRGAEPGPADLVVGTPVAGREREEVQSLIGFFVNTLALRVELDDETTGIDLLEQVRRRSLEAFAHQGLPFERLVEELGLSRDLTHAPLVQVMFNLVEMGGATERLELPGLSVEPVGGSGGRELDFDLAVSVLPTDDGIHLDFTYKRALFDPSTIERMAAGFVRLATALVEAPTTPVADLPWLDEAERRELLALSGQGATAPDLVVGATAPDLFAPLPAVPAAILARAAEAPDAAAVIAPEGTVSYRDLTARAAGLARALAAAGIGRDDRVAVALPRSAEQIAALLAVQLAGGAYVPFDPAGPVERHLAALAHADARALVAPAGSDLAAATRRDLGIPVMDPAAVPGTSGGNEPVEQILAALPEPLPSALAYVVFTSGSTGVPKGVAISHGSLAGFAAGHGAAFAIAPGDRLSHLAGLSFDASVSEVWPTLAAGATVVLPDEETRLDPIRLQRWLLESGVAVAFVPTPVTEVLLGLDWPPAGEAGALRVVWTGGDRLSRRPAKDLPFALSNLYGPTETTVVATAGAVLPEGAAAPDIGRPVAGVAVHLLDANLDLVGRGAPGEIYLGGDHLARGYTGQPALTAERFLPDPLGDTTPGGRLYRTGDLARWRTDGSLAFLGRIDQQVQILGVRVEPGEVEAALGSLAGVGEVAVVARPAAAPGEAVRLEAWITAAAAAAADADAEAPLEPAALLAALAERLPRAMVPSTLGVLAELPLTRRGKVDRSALLALEPAAPERPVVAPRTPLEERLAAVWATVLTRPVDDVHASFFDLGGHSLTAAVAANRLQEELGVEVPVVELFDHPTVASLAERLEERGVAAPVLEAIPRRVAAGERRFPLAPAQERLWVVDRLTPGNPAYNVWSEVRLDGPLEPAALAAAFTRVVGRHTVLRSELREERGVAFQEIQPPTPVALPVVDLAALGEERRRAEAGRLASRESMAPFDLSKAPLLRTRLMRLAPDVHRLLVTTHHVASDGWSMGLLVAEVTRAYGAHVAGLDPRLPELPVQYADFAVWQRESLAGPRLAAEIDHWRQALAGAPAVLQLPTDRPRPAVQGVRGGAVDVRLPAELRDSLARLGRRLGATPFATLLAGFALFLARLTGQGDLVVGSPVAGRHRVELERLLGCFVNTLPLRLQLDDEPSFDAWVTRTKAVTRDAFAHQEVPFERLVDELVEERALSHSPLFQAVFTLQNTPPPEAVDSGALTLTPQVTDNDTVKYDLQLTLAEGAEGFGGTLAYAADLFDRSTIERFAGHLETLLAAAAREAGRSVADLPLLTADETAQIVAHQAGAGEVAAPATGLVELFLGVVAEDPDAPALTFEETTLSYGELAARADALARRLVAAGVRPGSSVAIRLPRGLGLVVAILGVLRAGAAYVPLDPTVPEDRLRFILDDARAPVMILETGADGETGSSTAVVELSPDGLAPEGADRAGTSDTTLPDPRLLGPEMSAYVLYTSGSTGRPKGVVVRAGEVVRLLSSSRRFFGFGADEVWTLFHSAAFDFSVWEIWGALAHGARLVVVPYLVSRSPEAFLELLVDERVTVLDQTPSAFRQLIAAERGTATGRLSLRWVIFGGEALEPATLAPWVARHGDDAPRLVNMYGITETTVHVTWRRIGRAEVEAGGASVIGRPLDDLSVAVLDRHGRPAPMGVAGELVVGGAGVASGYLGRPALTAERFVPDPHPPTGEPGARRYRSGDLGRWLPGGDLEYLGRIDHQVKVRGFRIELGEIESVLGAQPEVSEAVVLAPETGSAGERRLVAWVVPTDPAAPPSVESLRSGLAQRLPDYMVPAVYVFLPELPLTGNGKLDRRALPEPGEDRPDLQVAFEAPTGAVEEALATAWSEVLEIERIGRRDNFFALGGDSILAIRTVARVRELGVEMALADLFQHQTLAELAPTLGTAEAGPGDPAAQVAPFGLLSSEDRARIDERWGREVEDAFPLSELQGGMIYHMGLSVDEPLYHNVDSFHLRGRLDAGSFERALARVVARHPMLRTSFHLQGFSEPLQVVHRRAVMGLDVVDLTAVDPDTQERLLDDFVAREKRRVFDLETAPQLRFVIHRRGPDEVQLTLVENHAIFDGWSLHATLAEIFDLHGRLLAGLAGGEDVEVDEPLGLTYRHHVAAERETLASEEAAALFDGLLSGETAFAELPRRAASSQEIDLGDEDSAGRQVASHSVTLAPDTVAGLLATAETAGVPLKTVLLAAHMKVLSLLAGSTAVATTAIWNGRPEVAGGDDVRGLYLNSLPFALDLAPGSWLDLARQTFDLERRILPHRRYPFAALVRRHGERSGFDVAFNYVHFHVVDEVVRTSGFQMLGMRRAEGGNTRLLAHFSRSLGSEGLTLTLEWDRERLPDSQAEQVAAVFRRVLAAMAGAAADPDARHDLLPAVVGDERRTVVSRWARGGAIEGEPRPIEDLLAHHAAVRPDAPAVVAPDGQSVSFAELLATARAVAHRLAGEGGWGLGAEDRVAVCLERSPEQVAALVGIAGAGAVFVPLDPEQPAERLRGLIEQSGARAVLTSDALVARVYPDGPPAGVELLDVTALAAQPAEDGSPTDDLWPRPAELSDDALAYVIFTSGSTGTPKGVAVSRRCLAELPLWRRFQNGGLDLTTDDRVATTAGLGFDALLIELFTTLAAGAVLLQPTEETRRQPEALAPWLAARDATVCFSYAALAEHLVALGPARPASLRAVVTGGDRLRLRPADADLELWNLYGPTEATVVATGARVAPEGAAPVERPPTIGAPVPGTAAWVTDRELRPVPVGTPGELVVAGRLARGYLGRPAWTAERFVPDPWAGTLDAGEPGGRLYRTGDRVRWGADGRLEFLGRLDHQVQVRGFRVELGEVETALARHPEVAEAAVAAVAAVAALADADGRDRLVAWIVPRGETPGDGELVTRLRRDLAATLPAYMVPGSFVVLPELPLSPSGKVDRRRLPVPEAGADRDRTPYEAPEGPVEETLAGLWREVLGVERVGRHDGFFELGGHSLLASRLVSRVRVELGRELPMTDLFARPTVAGVASLLADGPGGAAGGSVEGEIPRQSGSGPFPLSPAQGRLWFHDRLEPGSPFYNMPTLLRLAGDLDRRALAASIDALVARHETLRTVFREGADGEPVQVILPPAPLGLAVVDLQALPETVHGAEVRRLVSESAGAPFDLETGPVLRGLLLAVGPREHVLALTVHHIASDGWSQGLLVGEMVALYRGFAGGEPAELPLLDLRYADFAVWQRRRLEAGGLERQVDYWRSSLAGVSDLDLPLDRPRPPVRRSEGGIVPMAFPREVVEGIERWSRERGVTPFVLVLAAFGAVLGRLAGQDGFVVGSPVANRTRREIEPLVGFFVNTLPLQVDLSGRPTFADLVARARETAFAAQDHQDVPFERLVEELDVRRDPSRTPLFQVSLNLLEASPGLDLPGLEVSGVGRDGHQARFDLGLALQHGDGWLAGEMDYVTALFDATTIQRLCRSLERFAAAALAAPDVPVAELAMEGPALRHQILREWSLPLPVRERVLDAVAPVTLGTLYARQVAERPETALFEPTSGDGRLTYGAADLAARRIASRLLAAGVGPWVPVTLAFDRGADQLVSMLGTLRAGGFYQPVDLEQPRERLAAMVEEAARAAGRPPVVVHRRGADPRADALVDGLVETGAVAVDLAGIEGSGPAPELPWPPTGPDEPAYVMYTSGSTGRPKGVVVPHRGVVRVVTDTAGWSCRPGEKIPHMANIAFDAATFETWLALAHGGTLVPVPREVMLDPVALTDFARRHAVPGMVLPAAVLARIGAEVPAGLAGLRWASQGGEAADVEAVRRVLSTGAGPEVLLNCYGPTETTVLAASERIRSVPRRAASVPIGRPAAATRLAVVGPDGLPVPLGAVGELAIGGEGVSLGYLGQPARTARRFRPDPEGPPGSRRYLTGDLVRQLADGRFDFVGRTDHQVKIRGLRIEPGEVEAVLAAHPRVEEAVVLILGERQDDRRLAAFAAVGEDVDGESLREWVAARLPRYMVPRTVVVLSELPLNANDKVDRDALAALEPVHRVSDPTAQPRTETERLLAACFVDVLKLPEVGIHDDFFDIGGHSLLATQLVSRIRAAVGREIPLAALFDRPTVAELALLVDETPADVDGAPIAESLVPRSRQADTPRDLPLSYSQERLFLLERFEPGNAAYSIPMAVAFHGRLERGALADALARVVARHEVLRTTFELAPVGRGGDGRQGGALRPVQRVHPADAWPVAVPVVDLSGLARERAEAERERLVSADAARPFDLARGPLYRFHLFVETSERTVFFLNMHHIVADGWSFGLLIEEVSEIYGARLSGREPELAELSVQYADYALWQRRHLEGETRERQLGYWKRQLGGAPASIDLPFDRPRRPVRTFAAGTTFLTVPGAVAEPLRRLATSRGASLFMVLLAAFEVVVSRLSGETDVVVGTPVAGRSRDEVEPLLGMFLNTLVLRTDLSGDPTFVELVDRVRKTALGAYAHQDVPFEMLLDELGVERDLSRSPLFQLFFNMIELPVGQDGALPGVGLEPVSQPEMPTKFDLTLYVRQPSAGSGNGAERPISITASYDAELFDRSTLDRLLAQLLRVMEAMATAPEERIGGVSLTVPADRAVLPDPTAPQDATWHGPITDALARWAREAPERTAVEDSRVRWSYRELDGRADRLAHRLVAAGVGRGDRVAIWAHRSASVVEAVYGTLGAGAAAVLLDPTYPAERAVEMVRRSGARALVVLAVAPPPPEALLEALGAQGGARVDLAAPDAEPSGGGQAGPPRLVDGPLGPGDAAMVGFTSGSTGVPKGIVGRHGSLTHFLPWQVERFEMTGDDRFAMLSSLAHDPLQRDLFTPVWLGATLVIPDAGLLASGPRLAAWMAESRATVAHLTPAMGQILTQTPPGAESAHLPAMRSILLVGDALTRRDVARLRQVAPGARVVNLYGSTETQRAVAYHPAAGPDLPSLEQEGRAARSGAEVLPLGTGMEDVQLLVLGSSGRRLAGVGEVGEIAVRSPHLALGYLDDPAATAARFVPNPLASTSANAGDDVGGERVYLTGDLGRVLPDGAVRFMGRSDSQVKIRGFRIELAEVESHLGEAPGVAEAAVIARSDGPLGSRLAATVVLEEGFAEDAGELRRHLAGRLPGYMVPATFVFLPELPLTANRKLDRRALARLDDRPVDPGGEGADAGEAQPSSPMERRLAALLAEVLGLPRVGIDASFFDLGGNSLLLVELHGRLEHELGRQVSVVELFSNPTVRQLAQLLEEIPESAERPDHREEQMRSGKDRLRRRRGAPGRRGGS